jgi:hypothetical protein
LRLDFYKNSVTVFIVNSIIRFDSSGLFALAVTALELDSTPEYELDGLEIHTNDEYAVVTILEDNGIFMFEVESNEDAGPDESMDGDHASALASAGFGTDEDYGDNSYHVGQDE